MAVSSSQGPYSKKLCSLTNGTTVTGASDAFTIPFSDAYTFYLNVTVAGQTSTNNVFLTSVDGGTTYVNVPWKFAQVTTVTGTYVLNVRAGLGSSFDPVTLPTSTGALALQNTATALSLHAVVDPRYMKFGYTISGTSPTADLYVICWPKGQVD